MKRITTALLVAIVLAGSLLAAPLRASAEVSVGVSVAIGPPPLPYYPQPYSPGANFIWAPGYWAYDPDGYYWVPGTWVLAPAIGLLWTPGYWGWRDGGYWWNGGYWGQHVGFYGGIDYGYGYGGHGYDGGEWRGRHFYYNRAVSNVDPGRSRHTYGQPGSREVQADRVSFNGGAGGIANHATPEEETFAREHHNPATIRQTKHERKAMSTAGQRFSASHVRPDVAATERPGNLSGPGAVRRSPAGDAYEYHPPARDAGRGQARQRAPRAAPHPPKGGGGHPPR